MNLRDYPKKDGKKVWLSETEADQLLEHADGATQFLAFALGARSGLRAAEIVEVAPQDVVETEAGPMVRVWHGKGDKYRESPAPPEVATRIETMADVRDEPEDAPLVDVSKRTVRRWVSNAGDVLQEETGEVGWQWLGPHDLRRTWANILANRGVDAGVLLQWGGWDDMETFRDHYFGVYSARKQREAREKVDWL
jgi:integrase